jgi:hypothetical protein
MSLTNESSVMLAQQKISDLEIKLNRLHSQKAALQYKLKAKEKSQRKARTRTLIQMGGLLELSPLPAICNINLGDDLQLEHPDKSATLLGILLHLCEQIPESISNDDLEAFKNKGINFLKKNAM